MKQQGVVLLMVVIAIFILGVAAAALLMVRPEAGSATPAGARPGPTFSVALARTPTGIAATLTVTNSGSEDLSELQLIRADIATLTGGTALPLAVGKLVRGATTSLVLPYTGPAPAANAPIQVRLQATCKYGLFGNGSMSRDVTTMLP